MAVQKLIRSVFPAKKGHDMVGYDLDDDRLKIVHVRIGPAKREVARLSHHPANGLSDDDLVALIKKETAALGVSAPRAFLTVPLHVVITRTIEIPSKDPDEIREIVNLQASRHTPYSRSEIIIDTLSLGVVRESYTKVLLVIVPKEIVARQIRLLELAGLRLEKVFFSPEGVSAACTRILGLESSESVTGVVHMDGTFTTFQVIQRGRILFIRGIPIGADNLLDEKEIYTDRFVEELQKSLESYVADELGPMPSTLLLTGVVADVTELDDLFRETLHIPLKHQTYFNYFSISPSAKQFAAAAKRVSFFNVIAPLLLFDKMRLDLTSDERKLQIQLESRGREMVKTGILMMTILTLAFALCLEKIWFKSAYQQRLSARYSPVREEAQKLERVFAKTRAIKDYLGTRGESIETLSELYDTLPGNVKLTDVKYEDAEKFSVKGASATMGSVFAFVTNLEKSRKFKGVKTKYVNSRNENGVDVADFEIVATLNRKGPSA